MCVFSMEKMENGIEKVSNQCQKWDEGIKNEFLKIKKQAWGVKKVKASMIVQVRVGHGNKWAFCVLTFSWNFLGANRCFHTCLYYFRCFVIPRKTLWETFRFARSYQLCRKKLAAFIVPAHSYPKLIENLITQLIPMKRSSLGRHTHTHASTPPSWNEFFSMPFACWQHVLWFDSSYIKNTSSSGLGFNFMQTMRAC